MPLTSPKLPWKLLLDSLLSADRVTVHFGLVGYLFLCRSWHPTAGLALASDLLRISRSRDAASGRSSAVEGIGGNMSRQLSVKGVGLDGNRTP